MIFSIFCCFIFPVSAANETGANVYSLEQYVGAGETLKVPVYISNNSGFLGFKLNFEYDSSILTPINVEYGEAISYGIEDNIEGDATEGKMSVYWAGTEDVTTEGIWFYINFSVNVKSKGKAEISVSYTQEDTFNENFEDVILNCSPITINISNSAYSDVAEFSLLATNCKAGESFSVCVRADVLTDIDSAVFEFIYDTDLFYYKSIEINGVRAAATEIDGGIRINASQITSSLQGENILTLNFESNENTVGGDYEFSSKVTVSDKEVFCSPCTVHISSGSKSGSLIYAEKIFALPGDTIKFPVKIENNIGIMGFKLLLSYDSDILTPISVSKSDVLSEGTLNDSIGVGDTGSISVLWNNTGEISTDGNMLLLEFAINEEADYSNLKIQVAYSESDTFNERYENVSLICKDIDISITNFIPVDKNNIMVKPSEGYIYSRECCCADIGDIVSSVSGTTVSATAYRSGFLGTGSTVIVKDSNGNVLENYSLVVTGDFDGDSATDVIDAALLVNAVSNGDDISGATLEAVDFDDNGYVDVADYQSTVNYILSN